VRNAGRSAALTCRDTPRAQRLRSSVAPGAYEHELGHHPHLEFGAWRIALLRGCRELTGGRCLRAETLVRALAHPLLWAGFQLIFYFSMVLSASLVMDTSPLLIGSYARAIHSASHSHAAGERLH